MAAPGLNYIFNQGSLMTDSENLELSMSVGGGWTISQIMLTAFLFVMDFQQ